MSGWSRKRRLLSSVGGGYGGGEFFRFPANEGRFLTALLIWPPRVGYMAGLRKTLFGGDLGRVVFALGVLFFCLHHSSNRCRNGVVWRGPVFLLLGVPMSEQPLMGPNSPFSVSSFWVGVSKMFGKVFGGRRSLVAPPPFDIHQPRSRFPHLKEIGRFHF